MTDQKRVFTVGGLLQYDGQFATGQEVYINRGVIEHIIPAGDTSKRCKGIRHTYQTADKVDMSSGIMLPGLVNCHHHAYSALARGMSVQGELRPFTKTLENLWWRLDKCLDREAVYISGLLTGMACLRHGCTAIIDHHSSPSYVEGSLETLADAFAGLFMTSVICCEVSDRNGADVFERTIDENLSFEQNHRFDNQTRGLFGLHASFTLSSASLERIARVLPEDVPVHVHVAEDLIDVRQAQSEGYRGPLHRLAEHGILSDKSLIVHGIHLSKEEYEMLDALDLHIVHNPQSNFNNSVGYPKMDLIPTNRLLLGTDGMSSNLLGTAQFAYLAYLGSGQTERNPADLIRRALLTNNSTYLSDLLGRPVGQIREGHPADFAIFEYDNPTPLYSDNIMMHVLFGLTDNPIASWVYARGNSVIENRELHIENKTPTLDVARKKATEIWERYLKQ